ncbi:DUF397 domain-containing protein [Streptomyces sp. NBC_00669]|uniref:DUF397 domain-containing protein n=1 Tax=unclassified Streptomyces TaxID=2593676 RepID=UPI002E32EAAC|nr:DUF397 domain-containing protein [Streptomyces sp. NBC_00669]
MPYTWRKSSYSDGPNPDSCVEVADGAPGIVPVRDSKDPQGPVLTFTADAWTSFLTAVQANDFPTL